MNTKLLLKVKQHILDEPRRLWMGQWQVRAVPGKRIEGFWDTEFSFRTVTLDEKTAPPCGTAGCIAGWTDMLSFRTRPRGVSAESRAIKKLAITELQAAQLFYVDSWPRKFREEYSAAKTAKRRARIVGQVIDDFIATDGWTK